MTTWIDFKALRAKLDFEQVLRHYGIEVKRKGKQHHGFCPLPSHQGQKNSPSFSANLERGIFQCFGCGAKGNILDFACMMSNADSNDGSALREVAVELQSRFHLDVGSASHEIKKAPVTNPEKAEPKGESPIAVNAPLDFELKQLDAQHPYLISQGFTPETIRNYGLGFCSRGLLKDRVAIPLHDSEGKLIGYAGRVVDDSTITEDNPRYRFPGARKRDGQLFEFRKTLFLYNGFQIKAPVDDLIA